MTAPLHPNLARIAAAYDEVQARASRGEISVTQAKAEVMHLVARDDEGVLWSIDPSSGQWLRRTLAGKLELDTPPTYGVATPTAHDLTRRPTGVFNPDSRILFSDVDESSLLSADMLRGATRRQLPQDLPARATASLKVGLASLLVAALAAVAFFLI